MNNNDPVRRFPVTVAVGTAIIIVLLVAMGLMMWLNPGRRAVPANQQSQLLTPEATAVPAVPGAPDAPEASAPSSPGPGPMGTSTPSVPPRPIAPPPGPSLSEQGDATPTGATGSGESR